MVKSQCEVLDMDVCYDTDLFVVGDLVAYASSTPFLIFLICSIEDYTNLTGLRHFTLLCAKGKIHNVAWPKQRRLLRLAREHC